jgi:iron complex outermembrane receptor protein
MKVGLRSVQVSLWVVAGVLGSLAAVVGSLPVAAQEREVSRGTGALSVRESQSSISTDYRQGANSPIPQLHELERSATTIEEWVAQIEAALVQITDVRVEATEAGLQVTLATEDGVLAVPETRAIGNALIADIPNAAIAEEFSQADPIAGIALVEVTSLPGNRVRVAITGIDAPPVAEVRSEGQSLVLGLVIGQAGTGTEDDAIQVVVTGEQDEGYNPGSASTATRTDTPLRDIPQSIQVVPRQVIEDQNATRLDEALRNVPGVFQNNASTTIAGVFNIRGFDINSFNNNNFLRNGLRDPLASGILADLADVERVEVLRGPASILYGGGAPGGTINLVTKQPLSDPSYAVDATIGTYDFYRGAIDLSEPINDPGTIAYRLNAAYLDRGSFIDFYDANRLLISPTLRFELSERTRLTLEGDYSEQRVTSPYVALPTIGTVLPNPNGDIPRDFFPGEPDDFSERSIGRVGYRLEHEFSENWSLRNAFRATFYNLDQDTLFPTSLAADNRTFERIRVVGEESSDNYSTTLELNGAFSTGSIDHQLVVGVDLARFDFSGITDIGEPAAPIDLFDPVYGQPRVPVVTVDEFNVVTETLGVYLQDQIALTEDLRLVLGGRFDTYRQANRNLLADTESRQSDSAFSPFVGVVYQPVEPISLYASYSRSFTPVVFGTAFGDDQFEAERATQYEIGIKADVTDQLSATLALYELTRSNVLTNDNRPSVPPGFSIQTGEQRSRGIEFNVTGEILPGWNVIGGYAYTDARITEDNTLSINNRLEGVPENALNLWTAYTIQSGDLRGLGFGIGLFFIGERPGDLENTFELPSYLRTDAAIYYQRNRFRAAINLKNLFDIEYFEISDSSPPVAYGEPFTVQGTISWEF